MLVKSVLLDLMMQSNTDLIMEKIDAVGAILYVP